MDFYGNPTNSFSDIFSLICSLIICIILVPVIGFWIWMLIDVIRREFRSDNEKLIWVIIVSVTNIIGSLIYFFMIKKSITVTTAKEEEPQIENVVVVKEELKKGKKKIIK